ncbi:MAG TPA: hypothetical protein VGL38_03285 [bacterium]
MVRSMLRSLPTVHCSPKFEYRLQRKLAAEEAGVRAPSSVRNWTLGWAGAGLGFATALAIAFFAFDLNVKSPNSAVTGSSSIAGASAAGKAVPVVPNQVSAPANELQASTPKLVSEDGKTMADAKKDSTKPPASKPDLQQENFHLTGASK